MDIEKKEVLLFGTTRYSNPLSESDKNKFIELSKVASLNLLTYGDHNSNYFENEVYFQSIKEPKILLLKYIKFYIFSIFKLRKIIIEKNVSIVFAKDAFTGLPVVIAKKIFNELKSIKLVIESHGDYREMVFQQRKYLLERLYKLFVSKVGDFVVKNSDMIRGVTPESVDLLSKGSDIPTIHFPAWVDNNIFDTDNAIKIQDKKDIVFVGNIIPRKGVLFLLESFKEFLTKNDEISFILVGDTPNKNYYNECREYITRQGLERNVKFLGKLAQPEIARLMNNSKVLVLASSYEGLPRVLIEAGLCSLPSIAPDIEGIAIPFGRDGGTSLYKTNDHSDFLFKLDKLYNNEESYLNLVSKSYKLSNELSGKNTFANNWQSMIEKVML